MSDQFAAGGSKAWVDMARYNDEGELIGGGTITYGNSYSTGGTIGGSYYDLVLGKGTAVPGGEWVIDAPVGIRHAIDTTLVNNGAAESNLTFAATVFDTNGEFANDAPPTTVVIALT